MARVFIERFQSKSGIRLCTLFVLLLNIACANATVARNEPYRVLILHSYRSSLPVTTDWYEGILRGFSTAPDLDVEIDSESPDLSRFADMDVADFSDKERLGWLLDFYLKNYHDRTPHLIISTDTPALRFLLVHGEGLFPGVPIVFVDAGRDFVSAQKLPANVTGVTNFLDITGTLELILRLHPGTQRVAVIVGSSKLDRQMEYAAQPAIESFAERVEFVWLRGMPVDVLIEAVNTLPERTVALFLVQLRDRTGKPHIPQAALRAFSAAANVPVYGLWDTLLGHGIVGGRLATVEEDGCQAAKLAVRILRGETPADLPVVDRLANPPLFDGTELARWNIKENRLPAGSQILNRPVSTLDEYRIQIMITVLVVAVQGIMIAALMLNRRRLRQTQTALHDENDRRGEAETIAAQLRGRLARFSKERSLGTMATMIAHEINQPLIAIQNYAQAAKRRLETNVEDKPKLIELFGKIEGQASRAGDITQRVRSLVNSNEPQLTPTPLFPLIEEVIGMMELECNIRGCHIICVPAGNIREVLVLIDALQVQLVLVNLLSNAIRSVCAKEESSRQIAIEARLLDNRKVRVSVTDTGSGVPPDRVADIFEFLYSGSGTGMGMGLTICRDIIGAHGGRIWFEPNPAGGAIFRFTLQTEQV